MEITTHQLAKYLLTLEDKPIVASVDVYKDKLYTGTCMGYSVIDVMDCPSEVVLHFELGDYDEK